MKKILKMSIGESLVENLNRNVLLDHLDSVEKGIAKHDDVYDKNHKQRGKLQDLKKFICWKYRVDDCEITNEW